MQEHPYHVTLGMPIIHELPPKWMENGEVLHHLRGEVKPHLHQTKYPFPN